MSAMVTTLRSLKMFGMAHAVSELAEQGAPAYQGAQCILGSLLKAEMAEREVRSIAYQIKIARFPAYKDLAGFDFAQSEVNEAMVRQLHRGEFLEQAHNVVLIGGPGTGKTHLATAFGVQALEHHRRRVRFFPTVELVNALELEKTCRQARPMAIAWLRRSRNPRRARLSAVQPIRRRIAIGPSPVLSLRSDVRRTRQAVLQGTETASGGRPSPPG